MALCASTKFCWKATLERVKISYVGAQNVIQFSFIDESHSLILEFKMVVKFHLKLNITPRQIANEVL